MSTYDLVIPWPLAGYPTQDSILRQHMSVSEFDAYLAFKEERKVTAMAVLQAHVDCNGCNDREDTTRTHQHPGTAALESSLHLVLPHWRDVCADTLRFYRYTGKPPLDVTTEDMTQLKQRAQTVTSVAIGDAFLNMLPKCTRGEFITRMIPFWWLLKKMNALCVSNDLRKQIIDWYAESEYDAERMWVEVVRRHNGFCKTVLDLQQHAR